MQINLDCVRDVMLCAENNTGLHQHCYFLDYHFIEQAEYLGNIEETPAYQAELEKRYDNEEIIYHLKYCIESGLLVSGTPIDLYQIWIIDLTPKGHDFLANIRRQSVWANVKKLLTNSGSTGVDVVIEIAKAVAVDAAKKALLSGG